MVKIDLLKNLNKIWSKKAKVIVSNVAAAPQRVTKTMTDPVTRVVRMEREIIYGGKPALVQVQSHPNGITKTTIHLDGHDDIVRTKEIIREKNGSILGGDKITIKKDETQYWCYGYKTSLVKEYNPYGALEHKELTRNLHQIGKFKAIQDRVYAEIRLSSSADEMIPADWRMIRDSKKAPISYQDPFKNNYTKYSYENSSEGYNGFRDNYGKFVDGAETNYTRALIAKEQAAKKAEQQIIDAKLAAEKAAAELKANQPRINTERVFNMNLNDLIMKESKLQNGFIERVYTAPGSDEVLIKTQDMGKIHKEWIYPRSNEADMIYVRQISEDSPYVVLKKGNYTQINTERYYEDGMISYASKPGDPYLAGPHLRMPYKETNYYKDAKPELQKMMDDQHLECGITHYLFSKRYDAPCEGIAKLEKELEKSYINLENLFKPYTA